MQDNQKILLETIEELKSTVVHLEYSYKKVSKLSLDKSLLDEEGLESWEGFVSRFGRVSDLYLSRYLRTKILILDPAFRGELLDILNRSEKAGIISSADDWYEIRKLRNFSVHEYAGPQFSATVQRMLQYCPLLLATKNASV